jgi:hypothetical protein
VVLSFARSIAVMVRVTEAAGMAFREVSVNEIREVRRLWLGVAGLPGEPDVRRHTNIPAVATAGVPDALHREPGTAMISALGFTADHYAAARRTSGERAWASLYLGVPSSPEGGLVKRVWLDQWRMACAPTAGRVVTAASSRPP